MSVESIAETLLEKLKNIAQTETVIGEPIQSGESTVIPVSRVSLGMGMGGHSGKGEIASSGGGVRIDPVAFLVLKGDDVKVLPVERARSALSKIADLTPDMVALLLKNISKKNEGSDKEGSK
ncbi:MAG: hypothetical protein LBQ87_03265 [Candidatus Fibromonas sp.]|jgi:uncharacterized spore protein YtfJ|nr:hypothetical protein [Candidatus Fibromonas sp.]